MAKKVKKKVAKKTVKKVAKRVKKAAIPTGPIYCCSICGAEVMVTKEGNFSPSNLTCCEQQMTKKE